ncbi:hypothetical protein [Fusobacterium polymorphum]|jgi:hypothetical protein|uniref:hypothetical protein n=1 Tax=Fusobacterium nucleatum subsp. polymorphum TaxID=76857 RepID=UPI00204DFD5B|nr:MAG TPA: hypothetical protein [Caudoviricetes sp.]
MSSKSFEELKKEFEEKQKKEGLFTDSRWNDTNPGIVVGYSKLTYEERLRAVKLHMSILFKQGVFTQEEYEKELAKEIQKIKKEYNIKD